ncbi:MAG: radical SAM protein [bacterium]|nr:radical SAM protein [bacterium]
MWLAYAAGCLSDKNYDVTLIDSPADDKWPAERIIGFVAQKKPELILLDTSTPSIRSDAAFAKRLKQVSKNSYIAAVGPHVTALPEKTLRGNPALDAVLMEEYELTAVELAEAIENNDGFRKIGSLAWRDNGDIVVNAPRPLSSNLDEYPNVSRVYAEHLDINNYFYSHSQYPIVATLTARGCPYRCLYCVYPQVFSGHEYRPRSIPDVIDELRFIKETWPGIREIMFEDDTFSVDHERTRGLCEAIIDADINIGWSANARADLGLETLKIMKEAGCRLLCVGVESGDDNILGKMGKQLEREGTVSFFENAKEAGILIHGCFMVGNRGETRESMEKTLSFAKTLMPDTAQFFPIMAYPGTAYYRWAESKGYITTDDYSDWVTDDGQHNCVVKTGNLTPGDLIQFCDYARRSFYLSPAYILKKIIQSVSDPHELSRTFKSALIFLRHLIKDTN